MSLSSRPATSASPPDVIATATSSLTTRRSQPRRSSRSSTAAPSRGSPSQPSASDTSPMVEELAQRRTLYIDLALYAVSAAVAAALFWWSGLRPHRAWGITSVGGYAAGALATVVLVIK